MSIYIDQNSKFIPTWAYIKQHNQTKLKYFGITTKNDPYLYRGSGKYWYYHIRKHGNDVSTIWCQLFTNPTELYEFAEKFSAENNIVESKEWANLIPETGRNGNKDAGKKWMQLKNKLSKEEIDALNQKDSDGLRNYWANITEEARNFRTRRGSEEVKKHWDSLTPSQRKERADKSGRGHKGKRLMQSPDNTISPKIIMITDQEQKLREGWTYSKLKCKPKYK